MFLDILNELMVKKGINKSILSKESGVPYTTIDGFYKKGCDNIKLSTLEKIADYFGVTIDYLLGKEETKKAPRENEELIEKLLRESSNKAVVVMFGGNGPKVVEIPPEAEETVKRMLEAIDKNNTD